MTRRGGLPPGEVGIIKVKLRKQTARSDKMNEKSLWRLKDDSSHSHKMKEILSRFYNVGAAEKLVFKDQVYIGVPERVFFVIKKGKAARRDEKEFMIQTFRPIIVK